MHSILRTLQRNLTKARFTYILAAYCILNYLVFEWLLSAHVSKDDALMYLGAPIALDIYEFQYWGIITNSFVHFRFGNFILNLFGLIFLGSYVERRIGSVQFFFFGLYASTVSSAFQLAFSDDAGLGLSGVNYALFGFIFFKTFYSRRYRIVTRKLALLVMLFFIPFCFYQNLINQWHVAVIAMTSGFLIGILISLFHSKKLLSVKLNLILLLFFSVASIFYSPWNAQWNCHKGMEFHIAGKLREAKLYYEQSLSIDPKNTCSSDNLLLIHIDELSGLAFQAHNRGDYIKAGEYYDAILKLDPDNQWAKNNKRNLP